ncbi:phage baseplate assembly protein V [Janthinobacterium violaceinigrum]|uniref:Phage baseplate assembly protein V n=1 Tax=Janthinobacterium violaceinigrum TaxID=2654252 RepID=A0A6I1HQM0_9BURK|nr:phage baseplate assembly protein V [Janthinobacterium violaceinigrum]
MHCMNADQSDLLRLLQNLIRLGTIAEVKGAKARVRLGPTLTTEWLKWATRRAGGTRTWSAPTVGEQVIVFSPGGDLTRGIILPALYSQAFDAPESSPTIHTTHYPDGAVLQYDHAAHALTATSARAYGDQQLAKHLAAADPHSQYSKKEVATLPKFNESRQLANTEFVQQAQGSMVKYVGVNADGRGVKAASESSIEITFMYRGTRCRERIALKPTSANLKRAENHRAAILHAIATNSFDYTANHVAVGLELAVGQDAADVLEPDARAVGFRVVAGGQLLDGGAVDVAAVRGGAFGGDAEELGFSHGGGSRLIG